MVAQKYFEETRKLYLTCFSYGPQDSCLEIPKLDKVMTDLRHTIHAQFERSGFPHLRSTFVKHYIPL